MSDWVINVNDGQEVLTIDDGLYDVTVSDTFNPFGNYAKAWFDDLEGELFDLFRRGTKVSFQYNSDHTDGFTQRFVGYVINDLENDADGAEQLEIEAYTFDQFLRGDEVSNDQTGKTIFEALEDVITTDVPPIDWNPSLVEVVNNIELTQSFQGKKVEEFILTVRQKSSGEIFGVNEDLEFFFGPSEASRTRRDIDNSQWINHDIGEQSGETKNQVTVHFADGDRAVTVDDTGDQLRLQDNLTAGGPGQEGDSITRDELTNIEDAIDAGEEFLQGREATITGPVTTFELNDVTPGETIGVEIEPRGIDTDFRIAENLIRWQNETNELTVVAKRGADDDILIEQSKTLDRVEGRPRDLDVIPDRVTDTQITATLSVEGDADGVGFDVSRVTNDGRKLIRDGWIDNETIQVTELAVSTSDDRPSRSDSSLESEIARETVTQSLPTATSVEYSADFTEDSIRSVGLFATDTLIAIGRLENTVTEPSVTLTIDVNTLPDEDKSGLVLDGQTATRDLIADNTPNFVNEYAYGSTDVDVEETDTSLTTVATNELDNVPLQSASTTTDFTQITTIDSETPIIISSGELQLAQSNFVFEAENPDANSYSQIVSSTEYSGGDAGLIGGTADNPEYNFTNSYDIPSDEFEVQLRIDVFTENQGPEIELEINGQFVDNVGADSGLYSEGLNWYFFGPASGVSLPAGSHTIKINTVSLGSDDIAVDVVSGYDNRFEYTFDNQVHEDNGYLDGPELHPMDQTQAFATSTSDIPLRSATVEQTLTDTTNNQAIIIDGDIFENTESATVNFSPDRVTELNVSSRLSRFPVNSDPQNATPRFGYNGQAVDIHEVLGDLQAITKNEIDEVLVRSFTDVDEAIGETFAEGGQQSDGTLLTRARVPEFVKEEQRVISSERLRWVND